MTTLPKLTVAELMQVCNEASAIQRKRLAAMLTEVGADTDTRIRELKEADRYAGNLGDLLAYLRTLEGSARIVGIVAARAGTTVEALAIDPEQLTEAAVRACGWDVDAIAAKVVSTTSDPPSSPSLSLATG